MVEPLIAALRWQQITAMARMPLLPAPLTALAIGLCRHRNHRCQIRVVRVRGWRVATASLREGCAYAEALRLGGIPGAAVVLLLQLGDLGGKGSDPRSLLLVLLNQLQQQGAHAGWCRFQVSVGDSRREGS